MPLTEVIPDPDRGSIYERSTGFPIGVGNDFAETVDDLLRFATELLNPFTPYGTNGRKRSQWDFSDEETALNTYPASAGMTLPLDFEELI